MSRNGERAEESHRFCAGRTVESRSRFIEEQYRSVERDDSRNGEPPFFAARKLGRLPLRVFGIRNARFIHRALYKRNERFSPNAVIFRTESDVIRGEAFEESRIAVLPAQSRTRIAANFAARRSK